MQTFERYVGLDIHKDSTAVGVADTGRTAPSFYGEIASDLETVGKLARKLGAPGDICFCDEAGPCGYGVYRHLQSLGYECTVVAPALIPRRPGDRIKTDRRDAVSLSQLHRSGVLTEVWVPDQEQEAVRDLVRCRDDMKHRERKARQRLRAFLLRHGVPRPGPRAWTQAYMRWLEELRFPHPAQQIVLQSYVDAVKESSGQIVALEAQMEQALDGWSLAAVARGLMALRGISLIASMTIVSELGDITRFDSPRQLFASWVLCRASRRPAIDADKVGSRRQAMVAYEKSWPSHPGAIDIPHERRPDSASEGTRHQRPYNRSLGRHRRDCATDTDT